MNPSPSCPEHRRLQERDQGLAAWDLWGTYLPDRQWGTVREDYSANGDAWRSFPHEHARSRVYRWGEDGLLGISDKNCRLCVAPAFWNGHDPILKERLFGLANHEGNHGEDVKEIYFHDLNTPTHSYAKAVYLYPQQRFPYELLTKNNGQRSRGEEDYNIEDTGAFANNRFFTCTIEYAKASWNDIFIRYKIKNNGPDPAWIACLPTIWFRNTWSWAYPGETEEECVLGEQGVLIAKASSQLPSYQLECSHNGEDGDQPRWLFTDNETNTKHLYGHDNGRNYSKDAFHRYVIHGDRAAIRQECFGSKAAALCQHELPPGSCWQINLRLRECGGGSEWHGDDDALFRQREDEADQFYRSLAPHINQEELDIFKAASSGLMWTKKFFCLNIQRWLSGDPGQPKPPAARLKSDYVKWRFMDAHDLFLMPDGWEYPYYCKWDLMFHAVAITDIDPDFAKWQANILRTHRYVSPSAQVPAYEWAFSDVDPPLGAWATWQIYTRERAAAGEGDMDFLSHSLDGLLMEYGWWANRNDGDGSCIFDGAFLGLDNISPFDRRYPFPDGTTIEQADGTAWMAAYALHMLKISVELLKQNSVSQELPKRFIADFLHLVASMNTGEYRDYTCWDEADGFYYDKLSYPDGRSETIRVRSLAGLIPLLAVQSFAEEQVAILPELDLDAVVLKKISHQGLSEETGTYNHLGKYESGRYLMAIASPYKLKRISRWLFDEEEFLSPFGIRSLSKYHLHHPYRKSVAGIEGSVWYCPGESPVGMFGGNSNWRGPVWMPINFLIINALREYARVLGTEFVLEYPTFSGQYLNLYQIADDLESRLLALFKRQANVESRPMEKYTKVFEQIPELRHHYLFHEYFHGDNGGGLGASHQTGWTAMVRCLITDPDRIGMLD